MVRLRPIAALLAAASALAVLAGCGSTEHVTRTITHTVAGLTSSTSTATGSVTIASSTNTSAATTSSTSTSSQPVSSDALKGRSPKAIVDLASAALAHAGNYAMHADLTQGGVRSVIQMTTTGKRTFNAQTTSKGRVTDIIRIGSATYLKGNRAFWKAEKGSPAVKREDERLAGHWVTVPAATRSSVDGSLGTLGPDDLARCLREDHGSLTIAGDTTVGGQKALIVKDAGNAPGSTPSTIAVAASGTPYPLRYQATGPTRKGGPVDVCNNGKGGGAQGTITISQFGQIGQITRPTGASAAGGAAV